MGRRPALPSLDMAIELPQFLYGLIIAAKTGLGLTQNIVYMGAMTPLIELVQDVLTTKGL